jgi:hypothetical protein
VDQCDWLASRQHAPGIGAPTRDTLVSPLIVLVVVLVLVLGCFPVVPAKLPRRLLPCFLFFFHRRKPLRSRSPIDDEDEDDDEDDSSDLVHQVSAWCHKREKMPDSLEDL